MENDSIALAQPSPQPRLGDDFTRRVVTERIQHHVGTKLGKSNEVGLISSITTK